MDDSVRKQWIDFVKRSYCGELKITTNTCLCSVHFTPDSYSDCHWVKSGYLTSLALVSGTEPTLSVPPTAHALISASIVCPPATVPLTTGAVISALT